MHGPFMKILPPWPQDRRPWLWVLCTLSSSLSTVTTAIKSGSKYPWIQRGHRRSDGTGLA